MHFTVYAFVILTLTLFVTFLGLILYYYSPGRRGSVEDPKFRMLDDDESEKEVSL